MSYSIEILEQQEKTIKFHLKQDDNYLSFQDVFKLWKQSSGFIEFYINELIALGYTAFYWEHPAINSNLLDKRYECIILKSIPLETLPINERAFKDYIVSNELVVDFMNLGKNARLIVPTKATNKEIYNHIGKFIRQADKAQIIKVFKTVGKAILEEIEQQKLIWLNTAGLGVIWLHIRLDSRPKYYKTIAYKNPEYLGS